MLVLVLSVQANNQLRFKLFGKAQFAVALGRCQWSIERGRKKAWKQACSGGHPRGRAVRWTRYPNQLDQGAGRHHGSSWIIGRASPLAGATAATINECLTGDTATTGAGACTVHRIGGKTEETLGEGPGSLQLRGSGDG